MVPDANSARLEDRGVVKGHVGDAAEIFRRHGATFRRKYRAREGGRSGGLRGAGDDRGRIQFRER